MTKILVKCIDSVYHGEYKLAKGQKAMMEESLAKDLEAFVRPVGENDEDEDEDAGDDGQKAHNPVLTNKMLDPTTANKDDGEGNDDGQSSASPAAPASAPTTAPASSTGASGKKKR